MLCGCEDVPPPRKVNVFLILKEKNNTGIRSILASGLTTGSLIGLLMRVSRTMKSHFRPHTFNLAYITKKKKVYCFLSHLNNPISCVPVNSIKRPALNKELFLCSELNKELSLVKAISGCC